MSNLLQIENDRATLKIWNSEKLLFNRWIKNQKFSRLNKQSLSGIVPDKLLPLFCLIDNVCSNRGMLLDYSLGNVTVDYCLIYVLIVALVPVSSDNKSGITSDFIQQMESFICEVEKSAMFRVRNSQLFLLKSSNYLEICDFQHKIDLLGFRKEVILISVPVLIRKLLNLQGIFTGQQDALLDLRRDCVIVLCWSLLNIQTKIENPDLNLKEFNHMFTIEDRYVIGSYRYLKLSENAVTIYN